MHFLNIALAGLGFAVASINAQQNFTVQVGAGGLTFSPSSVDAVSGDIINFEFHAKNHTVTQSTFARPCVAMADGINSGYVPVAADATTFPVWSIRVQETTPLWFYCAQGAHCTAGMVFALNVNKTSPNTFEAFLANAKGGGTGATTAGGAPASTGAAGAASSGAPAATGTPNGAAAGLAIGSTGSALAAVIMSLVGGLLVL